jgi:hypothetical protein
MHNLKVKSFASVGLFICAVSIGYGCAQQGYSVVAMTGTVIGVDIAQNPATQTPHAKLGYNRGELAFVPTNRQETSSAGQGGQGSNNNGGAKDSANVLMELRYGGIFDTGATSGIYQRLAVGKEAVQQPGASLMFGKDAEGKIDANAKAALQSLETIRSLDRQTLSAMTTLSQKRQSDATLRKLIDGEVQKLGYTSWDNFVDGKPSTPTPQQLKEILTAVGIK